MKKLFTSSLVLASMMVAGQAMADTETTVSSKAELEAALNAANGSGQDNKTVIYVAPGSNISMSNNFAMPIDCDVYIIGQTDEEHPDRPMIGQQSAFKTENDASTAINLHFENLTLYTNGGRSANSKYMFGPYKNAFEVFFGTFEFKNCHFTDYNRAIIRAEHNSCPTGSAGEINTFRIENCTFSEGYNQSNPMSLFIFGIRVNELEIKDNLFYNMGYLHSLLTFNKLTGDNLIDVAVSVRNNTVIARPTNNFMIFDTSVGQNATFDIANNLYMAPYWRDGYNNQAITDEMLAENPDTINTFNVKPIASIQYGIVDIKNNVLEGFKPARNLIAPNVDTGEDEGFWMDMNEGNEEVKSYLAPADVDFGWEKFTDAEGGLFGIWTGEQIYTAGADGDAIGAHSLYTDAKQSVVTFNVSVEGSNSAVVTVTPMQAKYLAGDEVTVSINTKGLSDFLGWSNGMTDATITLTLDQDLDLVAKCKEHPYLAIWNFEQVDKNNNAFPTNVAPNYTQNGFQSALQFVQWIGEGYVATDTALLQARPNKMGKPCIIARDSLFNAEAGHVAYIQFAVPAVAEGTKVSAYVGTENYMTKTTNLEYTLDGATWTSFATIDLDTPNSNTWNLLEGTLPAATVGKDVTVRIKGIEENGFWIGQDVIDLAEAEGVEPAEKLTFYFPYIAEISVVNESASAIETVALDNARTTAIFDLQGRRVAAPVAGALYLQGNKKFILK